MKQAGDKPYIFCLWDSADAESGGVLSERLRAEGYRFYVRQDEGDFRQDEEEAERLANCEGVLLLITEAFEKSARCKNILSAAVGKSKKLLPVLLGKVKPSMGTALHLASSQYLRSETPDESCMQKILHCPWLANCRKDGFDTMEEELEAIAESRSREREAWLRQWDSETESLLAECRQKWQRPTELYLSLRSGKSLNRQEVETLLDYRPDVAATVSTSQNEYLFHCGRALELDGEALEPGEERRLTEPALLCVDEERYLLLWGPYAAQARERGMVSLLESEGKKEVVLLGEKLVLGREHPWKGGTLNEHRVSRNHAHILSSESGYTVTDVGRDGKGSTNHTYLNEEQLEPMKAALLKDGDRIYVASKEICLIFHRINIREEGT